MRLINADNLEQKIRWFNNYNTMGDVIETIHSMPTEEAIPVVHGEWIAQDEGLTRFMCSVCNGKNHGGHEKFCPDCGAKMDKKDMRKKV